MHGCHQAVQITIVIPQQGISSGTYDRHEADCHTAILICSSHHLFMVIDCLETRKPHKRPVFTNIVIATHSENLRIRISSLTLETTTESLFVFLQQRKVFNLFRVNKRHVPLKPLCNTILSQARWGRYCCTKMRVGTILAASDFDVLLHSGLVHQTANLQSHP
jgi:hypothetical protein